MLVAVSVAVAPVAVGIRAALVVTRLIARAVWLVALLEVDLAHLPGHRPEQEERRHAETRDDQEAEQTGLGRRGAGGEDHHAVMVRQEATFASTPANRSSSGRVVSTTDRARW